MLTLSRRRNESIIIGNNIRLVVVEIGANKVKIGIEAPIEISIRRPEQNPSKPGDDSREKKQPTD